MTTLVHDLTRVLASGWNADKPWPPYSGFKNAGDLMQQIKAATLIRVPKLKEDYKALKKLAPNYWEGFHGCFLPAPACFIECGPIGFLASGKINNFQRVSVLRIERGGVLTTTFSPFEIDEADPHFSYREIERQHRAARPEKPNPLHVLCCALKVINLPHSLKIQTAPVHKDATRKMRQVTGDSRAFFYAQRTITLDIHAFANGTKSDDGTGRRLPWHYVRTHDRFRYGRDERVHGYWKGDDTVGIIERDYVAGTAKRREAQHA